jgi:ribosomal protein L37AE/L43A
VVAKKRVDAKKKEVYLEWVRERNAMCDKCGKKDFKRHGQRFCDPCAIKIHKKELLRQ